MKSYFVRSFVAALALAVCAVPLAAQSSPELISVLPQREIFKYTEGKHRGGELKYHGKIPVLTVAGSPDEIGEQVGALQAGVVTDLQNLIEAYVRFRGWGDVYPWLLKSGSLLEWNFPQTHRREFGVAMKTSKVNRDLLVLINTAFDVVSAFACSTIVAEPERSASGEIVFGRNLDLPRFAHLHELTMVTVYHPKDKHAFASIGFPGLFGVVSGMNEKGLALAVNEIVEAKDDGAKFNPFGTPKLFLLRRVLEECSTVDEAEALLKKATRTGMMAVTVADPKSFAVFEVTAKTVVRREKVDGILTCTNHFRSKELSVRDKCKRLDALDKSRVKAKLSVDDIGAALHAARFGDLTMQTMIFEPSRLRLHLAFGQVPSSALPRETLELGPLFKR